MNKNTAIITEKGEKISYAELVQCMEEWEKNISVKRSLVIVASSNTVAGIIGYLSCMKYKHVPVLLRDTLECEQMENYISDYRVNYLWVSEKWLEEKGQAFKTKYKTVYEGFEYVLLEISKQKVSLNEELALLLTTLGVTGEHKLVRLSYDNIKSNTQAICEYLNITENDRAITSLAMSYTYGLSVINSHLYKGATLLLTNEKVYSTKFWKFFNENEGTSLSGVPYMYDMLIKFGIFDKNIETLNTLTSAGGKLNINNEKFLLNYAQKYNKELIVMYGQTEATAKISYRPYKDMVTKIGSIGIPIPGGSMWLENQKGEVIEDPFNHGEIIYSGENVSMGYAYSYTDLVKGYANKDILHTGDIGYIDEDGYFYILTTCDGRVKISGKSIDLKEMEMMLKEKYPDVEFKCRTKKCYDEYIDKKIKIEIDTNNNININKSEVLMFVKKRTGINQRYIDVLIK